MTKYKIKYTKIIIALLIASLILGVLVIILNVQKFLNTPDKDTYTYITLISTVLVAVFVLAFVFSVIFNSNFIIDDKFLTMRYGLAKNQIEIVSITKLIKLENSNKLIVHYNECEFMVVFIDEKNFDLFSQDLLAKNGEIVVEFTNG